MLRDPDHPTRADRLLVYAGLIAFLVLVILAGSSEPIGGTVRHSDGTASGSAVGR